MSPTSITTASSNHKQSTESAVVNSHEPATKETRKKEKAQVGFTTATARAMLPALKFWYKSPLKLFRPVRVDYMAVAKALSPSDPRKARKMSFHSSTIGILRNAIKEKGFLFIPQQVLPPLIANSAIGGILFTVYLTILPTFHCQAPSVYELYRTGGPSPSAPFLPAFAAGAVGGTAASFLAHPMDSLKIRFAVQDMLDGRYKSMMSFAKHSWREVGWRTGYQGLGLTIVKDALGYGLFFGVFEHVRLQSVSISRNLADAYGHVFDVMKGQGWNVTGPEHNENGSIRLDPLTTKIMASSFVLVAGALAAASLTVVDYPLDRIRNVLFAVVGEREVANQRAGEDCKKRKRRKFGFGREGIYRDTWRRIGELAKQDGYRGRYGKYLFGGLNVFQNVPATSVGFLIFELFKHRFELDEENQFDEKGMSID